MHRTCSVGASRRKNAAGPKTIEKMKKYASGRGINFVLSHLPNIGKTIEHGAIENRVECIDNGDECAY